MSLDLQSFGRDYLRQLQVSAALSHLPLAAAYKLAGVAGRIRGPLRHQEQTCREAVAESGLAVGDWKTFWARKVDDHGAFCINLFCHDRWDRRWFDRHVTLDVAALREIVAPGKGCLFLTYHHAFQHTLCCLLGLAGFRVGALAAPEETSAIYDQVGKFIHRLHRGCAAQFNGGDYCFYQTPRQAVTLASEAFANNAVLISLNDIPVAAKGGEKDACRLLDRTIHAPTGSVRIAQRLGTPIVAGMVLRAGANYQVQFRRLDERLPYRDLMQRYFDFLAETLADSPDFWDGWNWFREFPAADLGGSHFD